MDKGLVESLGSVKEVAAGLLLVAFPPSSRQSRLMNRGREESMESAKKVAAGLLLVALSSVVEAVQSDIPSPLLSSPKSKVISHGTRCRPRRHPWPSFIDEAGLRICERGSRKLQIDLGSAR
jgi:hypothetical protein